MNKKNNVYVVLFGNDRYCPEFHYRAAKHKFDYLKDARAFAAQYSNATIVKIHFAADSGDMLYCEEIF